MSKRHKQRRSKFGNLSKKMLTNFSTQCKIIIETEKKAHKAVRKEDKEVEFFMNLQETLKMQRELNRLTDSEAVSLSSDKIVQIARTVEDALEKLNSVYNE